jgi:hypothetical protein
VATYAISVANTWEQKSIIIAGDTSGTWLATNGVGLRVYFDLGSGSNYNLTANAWGGTFGTRTSGSASWFANTGATFYITGVQLEKGSTATAFDYRPYGTELALCQRYCVVFANAGTNDLIPGLGTGYSTTHMLSMVPLPVTPRTYNPTVSYTGSWNLGDGVAAGNSVTNISSGGTSINCVALDFTVASGLTLYRPYYVSGGSSTAKIISSTEL